jgi:hypothetical protein
MTLALPLCADHQQQRKKLLYGWAIVLALCIPVAAKIGSVIGNDPGAGWGLLVGLVVFFIALYKLICTLNVLDPIRIAELGGMFNCASQAFLRQIPDQRVI